MIRHGLSLMLALALGAGSAATSFAAGSGDVTFIHLGDIHGHLIPRPNMREGDPYYGQMVGGLAYVYDEIKQIRKRHPDSLLINTGDTIQGSAEALYTSGQALVNILNKFKIDAFVPGNWDYLYGTERFRELFAGENPAANWHTLSANLYYSTIYEYPETRYASRAGSRVLPPYMIRQVGNVKVGIIGLTADRGPQAMSKRVMEGFTLTPGEFELREAVPLLRKKYKVDLLVLISERGLAANLELVEKIPGVDIVLSSDMHEETWKAVKAKTGTILVEEGQDGTMVGEMTVHVSNGRMAGYDWNPHRISVRNNKPDPEIAALVEQERQTFIKGTFAPHVNPINGSVLRMPVDTVIGYTKTPLFRGNFSDAKNNPGVIEGSSHDFLADAFRFACHSDLGMIRGFRYGTHIAPGPIKLEDIYHYIPIGPQIACGKISGDDIRMMIERNIESSLSPYVGWWGGGWVVAISGITYDLNPINEFNFRISNLRINGVPIDLEKMYSVGGYWFVDLPNKINAHKALEIKVLKDQDGGVLDGTDIVAYYLQAIPSHTVDVEPNRIRLLRPLPATMGPNKEIQPWLGTPLPDY